MAQTTATRFETALIYLAGLVQGLVLVTFPAASAIFASPSGFDLSGTQYGAMFIPQVGLAIAASAFAPRMARRTGLRGALLLGLIGDLVAMALLAGSQLLIGTPAAYAVLCIATGALGLGFGATVMALNTLVEGFFPQRADAAVLVLNALLGVGTALAPVLVALFAAHGAWWGLPLLMTGLVGTLLLGVLRAPFHLPYAVVTDGGQLPSRFWIYALAAVLYGVVETLCGNWATLYLTVERGLPAREASLALTAFWVAVTLGRVLIALLERAIPGRWIYLALPFLLALGFQFVSQAGGLPSGVAAFGAAGLACSGFLPFSISFAGSEFPQRAATMSGALIAFYQIGYGLAAFSVGPLRETAGVDYSTIYALASPIALALGLVALRLIGWPPAQP